MKHWGKTGAKEPDFCWWLSSRNTDWHQNAQLATIPIEDCQLSNPAFGKEDIGLGKLFWAVWTA